MSGRETGNRGLGRFVRHFDEKHTLSLAEKILPKKYHNVLREEAISETKMHKFVNNAFEGLDVREFLEPYVDLPDRFRLVKVKETRPLYEKLCRAYQQKTSISPTPPLQKTPVATQKRSPLQKIKLKCTCETA